MSQKFNQEKLYQVFMHNFCAKMNRYSERFYALFFVLKCSDTSIWYTADAH